MAVVTQNTKRLDLHKFTIKIQKLFFSLKYAGLNFAKLCTQFFWIYARAQTLIKSILHEIHSNIQKQNTKWKCSKVIRYCYYKRLVKLYIILFKGFLCQKNIWRIETGVIKYWCFEQKHINNQLISITNLQYNFSRISKFIKTGSECFSDYFLDMI